MAKRHNQYSQLLGTVENGAVPMADVPNLSDIADGVESEALMHAEAMQRRAEELRGFAQLQPSFKDVGQSGGFEGG